MKKLIDILKKFKFTESEAKVYISLLQNGHCTGYELSKVSGVPRSKIYNILETLVSKGFVEQNTTASTILYQAIPSAQLSALLESSFQETLTAFQKESSHLIMREDNHAIWQLEDWKSICVKVKMQIAEAKQSLLIQVWVNELDEELIALINQKQQEIENVVVVLYDANKKYNKSLSRFYAHGFEQDKLDEIGHRWITVVADKSEVLYCTIPFAGMTKAIHTENPILAFFASEYVIHDAYCLRLIDQFPEQIKAHYGDDMEGLRKIFSF
ncbi:MAG TPA: helix-turn-helix domain-containing protein [Candidatus Jeotgalibaca pullicola]|nr:helix-turn-helix domain-containing protein [Candidatus Jeotgalibaca pullicola]